MVGVCLYVCALIISFKKKLINKKKLLTIGIGVGYIHI